MFDDDLLHEVRAIASSQEMSLGEVISQLARRGLESTPSVDSKDGLPVFRRRKSHDKIPLETLLQVEDEE